MNSFLPVSWAADAALMNPVVLLIWVAGAVQLAFIGANAVLPSKLGYRENLSRVSPMVRQIFVVHSIYMVIVLFGFSGLCFFFAVRLSSGDPMGRGVSIFLALFWLLRIVLQIFYYDSEYRQQHRLADVAYTLACCFLGGVFGLAALGIAH